MTLSESDIQTRAAARFGVLRSLCYPEATPTRAWRSVTPYQRRTTKHAATDGRRLTNINLGHFQGADVETQFVTLLHEVTHANDGGGYGRGVSSHGPPFWEEYARNFTRIADSQTNRAVVESLFNESLDEFDWHRARYRSVQNVSQVDGRSERVDERRAKLAADIDYDGYDDFENADWGLRGLHADPRLDKQTTALQANLFVPTQRYADEYTDEELLTFVEEQGGHCPLPLLVIDVDEWRVDGPQIIREDDRWAVSRVGTEESKKALAVQERRGQGYYGLVTELLVMTDPDERVAECCPIDVAEVRADLVAHQKRFAF